MRRAVHLGLNRQELINKALDGAGVPCAMLDPKLVGEAALPLAEVEKIPGCRPNKDQDIAEAEKLVKKHHPNGIDIEMAFRQVGNYSDRSQPWPHSSPDRHPRHAEDPRERGGIRGVRQGRLHADHRAGPRDGRHDPSDPFSLIWTTQGGSNYGKGSDRSSTSWRNAGQATNKAERAKLYHEAQRTS